MTVFAYEAAVRHFERALQAVALQGAEDAPNAESCCWP